MNISNYQVSAKRAANQDRSKQTQYLSLAQQYQESVQSGTNHPSNVTICCRIKRPVALGQREPSRNDAVGPAISLTSKRSGRSTRRANNNHSTLRSSTQSLIQNHMSSAVSIRSMHSVNSATSKQASARKTNRSSSLANIYSSNTGRSLTRPTSRAVSKKKDQVKGLKNGTANFVIATTTRGSNKMNRSIFSSKSDQTQTPISQHSRKSSSVSYCHNSSQQLATLISKKASRRASIDQGLDATTTKAEQCTFQIFSTVDDTPYVVCVPPIATSQSGFNSRILRTQLMTAEDLACLNTGNQICQLYQYDRVINDCYTNGNTVAKLYSKIVKHRV